MRIRRRAFLAASVAPARLLLPGTTDQNWLLLDTVGLDAARQKAARNAWARVALDRLLAAASEALERPGEVPAAVGQWPHWYSCKDDGSRLVTVSSTEHQCPVCKRVYRGDPYDAVVVGRVHDALAAAVRDLGLAWRFTGRDDYARRAREVLLGYAARYTSYPRHDINGEDNVRGGRVLSQTLDESVWLIPIAWGYCLVRDFLSPDERRRVGTGLLLPAAQVIREHRMGIHNIQCWKNSAVGLAGLAAGDESLVKEAIDDPDRGFHVQIERGVTEDGLWFEGSLGYHNYTMAALWPLAEAARFAGIDLYTARYRSLYDAPLALALPDGEPPGFNDSAGGNVAGYAPLYEIAYARYRVPAYGALVSRTPRDSVQALLCGEETAPAGPMIPERSALLPSAGLAMLRSSSMTVAVRFGRHGGGHGHPDKLNIVTFAGGRVFGLDPGSINYGVPLHREWYRSTIAHNTVGVDGQIQASADGRHEAWETGGGITRLTAIADEVYPGVTLRRSLALHGSRLDDRFECLAGAEHDYDWAFHAPGQLRVSVKLSERRGALGAANGYQHIHGVSEGRPDGDWTARWESGDAVLTLRFRSAPGTVVFTGAASGRNPAELVPMLVVRRRAANTVFEVTHEISARS